MSLISLPSFRTDLRITTGGRDTQMPHSSDDEHDEDDLPVISTYVTRLVSNERRPTPQRNDEHLLDRFQSNNSFQSSIESWHQLHQKSVQVLHDDDDDFEEEEEEEVKDLSIRPPSRATSTPARVPSLIRPSSPPAPASRARSPSPPVVPMRPTFTAAQSSTNGPVRSSTYEQNPLDSQKLQSKWQVRSPQLLSALVGPDRQSLGKTRRHTTEIIYQKANAKAEDFYLSNASSSRSNGFDAEERRKINPLVKQLRQKFDRLAENSSSSSSVAVRNPSVLRRVLSMTGSTTQEWAVKPADALLPRRPAQEIKATRTNSHATSRARQGPPISFRKQYFPPPSTLSVVKQLIDSGATLIYDSSARKPDPPATSAFPTVTLNERMESLKGSETMLTGRQISSNLDEDDYATITPQIRPEANDNNDDNDRSEASIVQPTANEDAEYYAVFDIKP